MKSPFAYPPNWLGGLILGESALGGPNTFPVAAGVQLTTPAYLYQSWTTGLGADELQSFVNAYNAMMQYYITWFCNAELPIYTGQTGIQVGGMLDWIAYGIYGFLRPLLPIGAPTTSRAS